MRTLFAFAFLALTAVVLAPIPAAAQRGCCFLGQSPPFLDGARFAASSREEARERTERLGFTWSEPPPEAQGDLGFVYFQRGAIEWGPGPGEPYAGLSGWGLRPLVGSRMYELCSPPPPFFHPRWEDAHATHPNSAIAVLGVIGVVGDLDGVAHRLRTEDSWEFDREFYQGDLGAYASEREFETGGFARLIEPVDDHSPSAAWMTADEGRWMGVVIECESIVATAAWLDAHDVGYFWEGLRQDALLVDPYEGGGVMFEFVQRGARPRA